MNLKDVLRFLRNDSKANIAMFLDNMCMSAILGRKVRVEPTLDDNEKEFLTKHNIPFSYNEAQSEWEIKLIED